VTKEPASVLVIDDDRATQRVLSDALTKQGFQVTVERDGEWAVKTFEKKHFDAVLLDLLLPAISGYEVAKKLRALPRGRKIPIVMISGVYTNPLHQSEAVQKHGAFAFLEKPIHLATLYSTLREALGDRYPEAPPAQPPPPPAEDDETTGEELADITAREEADAVDAEARKQPETSTVDNTQDTTGSQVLGDFSETPFPEVIAEIYRRRATGGLLVRRDQVKKIVYFREGTPISVKSNLLSECLGRVMVKEKMISDADCEASLEKMKGSGRQQGTVLIDMGCISPHNLVYALSLQLQKKVFDLFSWTSGTYQLNAQIALPAETVNLDMTTAAIIYEGIRRHFDEARLAQVLGDVERMYVHPSEHPLYALQDAGLGEDEAQFLGAADGHKTVATLRAMALLPPLETDRVLYAMKCAQMIELREKPAEGKPKPSIARLAESMPRPPALPPRPPQPSQSIKPMNTLPPEPTTEPPGLPPSMGGAPPPLPKHRTQPPMKNPLPSHAGRPSGVGGLLPEIGEMKQRAPSPAEGQAREQLAAKVAELRKMDYYELLGVGTNAPREEIKRAYFALAKEYHPDKHYSSSSAEVRQLARELFDLISQAHDTLADPDERERYTAELQAGMRRDLGGKETNKILAAEGKFQKGEELLRERHFKPALDHFMEAIALYDEEGEFHAYLGWTLFQLNPADATQVDRSLKALERAVVLNPKLDRSYLFTGYIYKATGRPDKAEKQFEKAIQCNPDCTEALRELRILGRSKR
jgi:CheY-like chemotaxis protein